VAERTRQMEGGIYTSRMIAAHHPIEWGGFLVRLPLPRPFLEMLAAWADAPLLITGAGGSIGSAQAQKSAHWVYV